VSVRRAVQATVGVLLYLAVVHWDIGLGWVILAGSATGLLLGKFFCRWMCPMGAVMELVLNVYRALRPGGRFLILDYQEQEPTEASWPVRLVFRAECPLATDFVRRDLQALLSEKGFGQFRQVGYHQTHVGLLAAVKEVATPVLGSKPREA